MDNRNVANNGPSLRLLILGQKRTGRSSVGNTILGKNVFDTWGGADSAVALGESEGRQVMVVDCCGWGSEENIVPKQEKLDLHNALSLCEPGPHILLLVIPLLHFSHSERAVLQKRMELLTEGVWRHTMVVFTLGDRLQDRSIQAHIEASGEDLQWVMEKCRYRYRVLNNKTSQDRQQVSDLLDRAENMLMENGGWHFSLHMYCRLEEEWGRRERELKERMTEREDEIERMIQALAVVPNQTGQGVLHVNDTPVKVVFHG
ncbi:GTPase IMAP family member 4 isoform X2 [Myxocyprinus asiaticus]|uniref:GTPase IMAP family member 4 isoform X2 n=1 Tax=Myxocyprinus asiaticus TaxID=70543 RepID=UPI002222666D|nr:GTPase IMAP family member 4 isoform X2 [Myxocyprinus asiaticus]